MLEAFTQYVHFQVSSPSNQAANQSDITFSIINQEFLTRQYLPDFCHYPLFYFKLVIVFCFMDILDNVLKKECMICNHKVPIDCFDVNDNICKDCKSDFLIVK